MASRRRLSPGLLANRHGPAATLLQGAAGSLALNLVNTGLTVVASIVLARVLGVAEYGLFAFVSATVLLLLVPSVLGLDRLLVREVSVYASRSAFELMGGLIRLSFSMVLVIPLSLALAIGAAAWFLAGSTVTPTVLAIWIGLVSLPLSAVSRASQATLMGLGKVVLAQVPELLVRPSIFLAIAFGAVVLVGLDAQGALWLQLVAVAIGVVLSLALLGRFLPPTSRRGRAAYLPREWLRSSVELAVLTSAAVINAQTGTFLLGALRGLEDAGLYAMATRGALLISFGLVAVNTALAPTAARMWASRDIQGLQRIVSVSARAALLFSLPVTLIFIVWGQTVLDLSVGPDFREASGPLAILSVGQLVNAGVGSVGTILMMTGHQRIAAGGIMVGAALNVVVGVVLIPAFGTVGAAVAAVVSMSVWNVILAIAVVRRVGVHPTALGHLAFPRRFRRPVATEQL